MPPSKRSMEDTLQVATNGVGQCSTTNKSPTAGRQKRPMKDPIRYGYKKELSKSPTPPADKAVDEGVQQREVIAVLTVKRSDLITLDLIKMSQTLIGI